MKRVLVIGADAAGMTAASVVARHVDDVEVVVAESGQWTSYSACGIPYWLAGDLSDVQQLVARTPEEHRARGIDLRLGHTVIAVDTTLRTATVRDDTGQTHHMTWDRLVIATGAAPVRPNVPGADAAGIHVVKTLDDGQRILEQLDRGVRRVVVVVVDISASRWPRLV